MQFMFNNSFAYFLRNFKNYTVMTLVCLLQFPLAQGHEVLALLCKHNIYFKEAHLEFNFLHWRYTFLFLKIKKNSSSCQVVGSITDKNMTLWMLDE